MRPKYGEDGQPERDRKGEIVYDKATKDTEIVPFKEDIGDYMAREVLPHVPDAKAFFMEDLTKKKPVIKTGAEFPFTRYFYKYQECEPSEKIMGEIAALEKEIGEGIAALVDMRHATGDTRMSHDEMSQRMTNDARRTSKTATTEQETEQ